MLFENPNREIKLVRKRELCEALGISPWTLDRWIAQGRFPKPVYVSSDAPARWRLRDIDLWIERQKAKRRVKPQPRGRLVSRMTAEERKAREAGHG